jgi:class 3 adenylate cyclase
MSDLKMATEISGRTLHAYVSDLALGVLKAAPESGWSEVEGTLAFFDISGFTKLTERLAALRRSGAEHINDVLNTVLRGLIAAVFRHDGDVLEFGGDAMVVLFTEIVTSAARGCNRRDVSVHGYDGRITTPSAMPGCACRAGSQQGRRPTTCSATRVERWSLPDPSALRWPNSRRPPTQARH